MNLSEEQLMREIQKVGFAVVDLHLYLDTHPSDRRALMVYNQYAHQLKLLKEMYSRNFGQLDMHGASSQYPFGWVLSPWPWEKTPYMHHKYHHMCGEEC